MTIIIIGLCAIGAWEVYVYKTHMYMEDLFLSVIAFGLAMFFSALWLNGVKV